MKKLSVIGCQSAVILGVLGAMVVHPVVFAQTNEVTARAGGLAATLEEITTNAVTVSVAQLRPPSDFQRLQYYYAAHPASPAPGSEPGLFTIDANRQWTGDWTSTVVPAPTRAQLDAITAPQVDVLKRAAVYRDGAWRVATAKADVPLSELVLTPQTYAEISLLAERARLQKQLEQLDAQLNALTAKSTP